MSQNTTGSGNRAVGRSALFGNKSGNRNVAIGAQAMSAAEDADFNTALGVKALITHATPSTSGWVIRRAASSPPTTIFVSETMARLRTAAPYASVFQTTSVRLLQASRTRISGGVVQVNDAGQLGLAPSSARFKDEIRPMDTASEAIFELNPVTFRYDQDIDPQAMPQFGLIAEEVEKINAALILPENKENRTASATTR